MSLAQLGNELRRQLDPIRAAGHFLQSIQLARLAPQRNRGTIYVQQLYCNARRVATVAPATVRAGRRLSWTTRQNFVGKAHPVHTLPGKGHPCSGGQLVLVEDLGVRVRGRQLTDAFDDGKGRDLGLLRLLGPGDIQFGDGLRVT